MSLNPLAGMGTSWLKSQGGSTLAGMTPDEAASTIFGIDILQDNVVEARARLLEVLPGTEEILKRNIVYGDFLKPKGIWFMEEALKNL